MKWNTETWSNSDGETLELVRAGEDGGAYVDGSRRDVKENDLYVHSGSDTVGVYSVNEDQLRNDGWTPDDQPSDQSSDQSDSSTPRKRSLPKNG